MKSITLTLDEFGFQAIRNALVHGIEYLCPLAEQGDKISYMGMDAIIEVLFDLDKHNPCKPKSVKENAK